MAIVIEVTGRITENGELEVKLPDGLPAGEVQVQIVLNPPERPVEPETWDQDELAELLRIEPLSGAEIIAAGLAGGWEDKGITDSSTWVEEQRRKRREARGATW